jgi:hypothetical protein
VIGPVGIVANQIRNKFMAVKGGLNQIPLGYQQITLSALSSLTVPTGAQEALITVETAAVRYRDDGTAPTAAIGMPLAVGATLDYTGTLANIQFIAQTGTPVLDILYYK